MNPFDLPNFRRKSTKKSKKKFWPATLINVMFSYMADIIVPAGRGIRKMSGKYRPGKIPPGPKILGFLVKDPEKSRPDSLIPSISLCIFFQTFCGSMILVTRFFLGI